MKTLVYDIETVPNNVFTWGTWNQNVGVNQIIEPGRMVCFAAKWHGEKKVRFFSEHHDGHDVMVKELHRLLDEADAVVTYNGRRFDNQWANTEFALAGLTPPSPWHDIDLLQTVKRQFRFPSNKLAYVTKALGLSGKIETGGFQLWWDIMLGAEDEQRRAWAKMRRYNKQDVVTTDELYVALLPHIMSLPNPALYAEDGTPEACGCGSTHLQSRGWAYTRLSRYRRYWCVECGRWLRSGRRDRGVDVR